MNETLTTIESKVDQILDAVGSAETNQVWFSLKEATEYSRLSESTLRRAIRAGTLKSSKPNGKILLKKDWLDTWIQFGKSKRSLE